MANWHYSPQFLYLQSQVYLIFMPQVVHGGGDGQGTDVITLVLVNPEWNIGTFVIHFTTNVFNITIVVFLSLFKIWNLGTVSLTLKGESLKRSDFRFTLGVLNLSYLWLNMVKKLRSWGFQTVLILNFWPCFTRDNLCGLYHRQ